MNIPPHVYRVRPTVELLPGPPVDILWGGGLVCLRM
jgi:hypothetical protein